MPPIGQGREAQATPPHGLVFEAARGMVGEARRGGRRPVLPSATLGVGVCYGERAFRPAERG